MGGAIVPGENINPADWLEKLRGFAISQAVETVTCAAPETFPAEGERRFSVALLDYGCKQNIIRSLTSRGCEVTRMPADITAKALLEGGFDGVMLSNGPGDPAENKGIITELQTLMRSGMPIFGICLGHQLLALAAGAKTDKLKYGHRGANHPVKDLRQGRTYITSQNHGYAVLADTVPPEMGEITHINLNDGTVEGIRYNGLPVFSVQYHPEACPGPADNAYLFDRFIELMKGGKA
jgi:carbamoyl-phosphate synthase small subunit